MSGLDTPFTPSLSAIWFALLGPYRPVVRQERGFVRLCALTVASGLALGRRTLTQLLVALGEAGWAWSAWYRRFNRPRLDVLALQETLLTQLLPVLPRTGPSARPRTAPSSTARTAPCPAP